MPSDSLGNWISIGNVNPGDDWGFFPGDVIGGETFRLTYTLDWQDWESVKGWRSFGLMRFYYVLPNEQVMVSPATKIYPKPERELREFRVPKDLPEEQTVVRTLAVKRIVYKKPYPENLIALPWSIEAEYL